MTKLADVARAAGVSIASASRALGGGRTVSLEVRRRVEAAAKRLDYRPNVSAQALASGPKRIAIVCAELTDPHICGIVGEVVKAIQDRGHSATIIPPRWAGDEAWVQGWAPSGIIFVGEFRTPVRPPVIPGVPQLSVADAGASELGFRLDLGLVQGFELACRYLRGEGHRRIGLLGVSTSLNARVLSSRIDNAGLSLSDISADTPKSVAVALRQALQGADSPTALVCASDMIALAALRYGAVEGIRVPQDLSVIGFADSQLARHSYPALSSIRISVEGIAVSCADAIFELLAGKTVANAAPAVRLVIRESSNAASVSREA